MRTGFILTVALSLLTLLLTTPLQAQDSVAADLDKLIARMPAKSAAEKDAIVAGMLKLGQAGVLELCGRIRTSDEPLDGNVCAALHGLAHAAAKPNAEDARRMVAGVFGDILEGEVSIAAKSFLITELRTVGGAESVGAVSALLKIDALCESAAQTLVSIGTPEAGAALRQGAANVKGKKRAVALFALGRMRDRAAVPLLLKDAAGKDDAVRHAALFALAEIGDPAAEKVLLKAAAANDEGECEKAAHRLLRFALRLAENGHKKNAIRVYRGLLAQKAQAETGIAPGAFYELMRLLEKNEALTGLVVGLGHPSVKVRTAALRVASDLPGSDVTQVLAKALVTLPAERRAPVAELLRQRGDPAALTSVTQALKDPAASVRIAAMAAVGGLGKRDVAPQLMAFLDQTSEEAEAARAALIAMGDKGLNEVLVETLPKATPEARCALLSVLAARDAAGLRDVFLSHTKDPDKNVRRTALKVLGSLDDAHVVRSLMALLAGTESAAERTTVERSLLEACRHLAATSHGAVSKQLIAAYGKADVPVRCALINAVTCLAEGYPAALGYVRAIRKDGDPAVRTAALRALADWPTSEPMEELLKVANDTKAMTDHVLALRGCIRMAGQHAASTNAAAKKKAIGTLKSTLAASRRTEEKRRVLGAVSAIGHPDALGIAVGCLNDDVLRAEATAAVAKIAQAMNRPATVLVAYDKRARTPPAWLKSWTDTGTDLQTTDVPLRVYSNIARKETITLGGNKAPGASSHYAVILTGSVQQAPVIVPAVKEALAAVKDDGLRKQVEGLIAQAEDSGDRASSEQEFHVAKVASGKGCKVVKGGLKNGAK
ncbi:MAG: hypothetical protein HON70_33850, partial [Lentisphaerae bacterium]|nr:hypothetical protein [Lentisphaerota bacterium]